MSKSLTAAEVDALLADDGGLAADIAQASMTATVERVRAKLGQLESALADTRARIASEGAMARKCVLIVLQARSECRPELAAAARKRERVHLEALYRAKYTVPRIELALLRVKKRLQAAR